LLLNRVDRMSSFLKPNESALLGFGEDFAVALLFGFSTDATPGTTIATNQIIPFPTMRPGLFWSGVYTPD